MKRTLRERASIMSKRALHYLHPTVKVVQAATGAWATVQKPTAMGIVNAVTGGLNTLADLVEPPFVDAGWSWMSYVPSGTTVQALMRIGATGEIEKDMKNRAQNKLTVNGLKIRVDASGRQWFYEDPFKTGMHELLRGALDRVLPPAVAISYNAEKQTYELSEAALTNLTPLATGGILKRTLALMQGQEHRSIMLEGRPGIGKTTMAQALARNANLGRVVILDPSVMQGPPIFTPPLTTLSPGVIIMDDIDKVRGARLENFERIRKSTRLLVVTANNGTFDQVIDAALARPARIDEIFTIKAQAVFQRPPFDKLTPAQWEQVSQWPQAYLNELELRLTHTPDELRIEDLLARLDKRTKSGDFLPDAATANVLMSSPTVDGQVVWADDAPLSYDE